MSDAREAVLGKLRRSLRRGPLTDAEAAPLRARLAARTPGVVPQRAKGTPAELVARFTAMAEEVAATVVTLESADAIPQAVADYLKGHNLPTELVATGDPSLDGLEGHGMLTVRRGLPSPTDAVAVVPAVCGVAETGTLMLTSGALRASTLNFLPETHIVVLNKGDVVGGLEEAWVRLRERSADGADLPRTVNFVTGPSRTGDIEQTIELGAHGPMRLHILLVDGPA